MMQGSWGPSPAPGSGAGSGSTGWTGAGSHLLLSHSCQSAIGPVKIRNVRNLFRQNV